MADAKPAAKAAPPEVPPHTFVVLGTIERDGRMLAPGDLATFRDDEEEHVGELFAIGLLANPDDALALARVRPAAIPGFVARQQQRGEDRRMERARNARVINERVAAGERPDAPPAPPAPPAGEVDA